MTWRLRLATLAVGIVFVTTSARAQTRHSHLGASALYNFDSESFGVGAQFSLPIASHLEFYPSFNLFFPDVGSAFTGNLDLKYRVPGQVGKWLYLGTGVGFHRVKFGEVSDTKAGWNVIAGMESLKGTIHPFAEGRIIVASSTTAQIHAGINITLGQH